VVQKVLEFTDAVKKYYSEDGSVVSFYSSLYREMISNDVLDINFVSQMVDVDTTCQRLSELLILKHCVESGFTILKGKKKKGSPDITFEFETRKVNIEVITPRMVTEAASSFAQIDCTPFKPARSERRSVIVPTPKMESLHPRITGALKEKADKFEGYISGGAVTKGDINIVCINLGFVDGNDLIDYPYLKNIFYKQEVIYIDIEKEAGSGVEIRECDFAVVKETGAEFRASYFDNFYFSHIDGAWVVSCNEKVRVNIRKPVYDHDIYRNVFYAGRNSKTSDSLLAALSINSPVSDGFIAHIKTHGKLP